MNNSYRRIAVTGASGFLGRSLCSVAVNAGWEVVAVVREPHDLPAQVNLFVANLLDSDALATAFHDCFAVVHTAGLAHIFTRAAQNEQIFQSVNVRGAEAVARAAKSASVPHLVLASSVSVYGASPSHVMDESAITQPTTPYARSKLQAEQIAAEVFASCGQLSCLRLATLYGEGDRGNVARLIHSLRRGWFVWPGSGLNRKSLLYKTDAARACLSVLQGTSGGIYNVSAPPVTMRDIVETICEALPRPVPRASIPQWLMEAAHDMTSQVGPMRPLGHQLQKFLKDDTYPTDRFCRKFDFAPRVSLKEGIAREVQSLL